MRKKILIGVLLGGVVTMSACSSKTESVVTSAAQTTAVETSVQETTESDDVVEPETLSPEMDITDASEGTRRDEEPMDEFTEVQVEFKGDKELEPLDTYTNGYSITSRQLFKFSAAHLMGTPKSSRDENGEYSDGDQPGVKTDYLLHDHTSYEEYVDEESGMYDGNDESAHGCNTRSNLYVYEVSASAYNDTLGSLGAQSQEELDAFMLDYFDGSWCRDMSIFPNSTVDKYMYKVGDRTWTVYIAQFDLDKKPEDATSINVKAWTRLDDDRYVLVDLSTNVDFVDQNYLDNLTHEQRYQETMDEIELIMATFTDK